MQDFVIFVQDWAALYSFDTLVSLFTIAQQVSMEKFTPLCP